jgi:hypothetical protein
MDLRDSAQGQLDHFMAFKVVNRGYETYFKTVRGFVSGLYNKCVWWNTAGTF